MLKQPNINALVSGLWMMEPAAFQRCREVLRGLDWTAHLAAYEVRRATMGDSAMDAPSDAIGPDGIARFSLDGPMMKKSASMQDIFGGTATMPLAQNIRQASRDPRCTGILLTCDSPGGAIDGTETLANVLAACSVPTVAFVDGLCGSAAYWVASQCDKIVSTASSEVGNIGIILGVETPTETAAAEGVDGSKVTYFGTGAYKLAGFEPINPQHAAYFQGRVDNVMAVMTAAVSKGRPGCAMAAVCDGRAHISDKAMALGLIDQVGDESAALEALASLMTAPSGAKETPMNIGQLFRAKAVNADGTATLEPIADASAAPIIAEHPCAASLKAAGIETPDQLTAKLAAGVANAALAAEYITTLRAEASAEAVRALGQEHVTADIQGLIADADAATLKTLSGRFKATADALFPPAGGTRQSVGNPLPSVAPVTAVDANATDTAAEKNAFLALSALGRSVLNGKK